MISGLAALALALPLAALGADWPQWRGPERNGVSKEKGLLQNWPKGGPPLAWTFKDAGTGFTAPAVVGGTVYSMGARKDEEYVFALDDKGKQKWATKIGTAYDWKENVWNYGPNATPCVDGDLAFALGSQGILVCVKKDTGAEVWRKDLPKELSAEVNPIGGGPENTGWGFAWSPLVDGDKLIITPGGPKGLVAALDKKTGSLLWQTKDIPEQATYASPVLTDIHGVRQYVVLTQSGAVGVSQSGEKLWEHRRRQPFPDVVIPTPIVRGDQVFSTAYKAGDELLKIEPDGKKFKATAVYAKKDLSNLQGGVVLVDNYVFGYHEDREWKCVDFATGEQKWRSSQLGAGSVAYADGRIYVQAENDSIVALLDPSPAGYKEVSRFKLPEKGTPPKVNGKEFKDKTWTHPVIADGHLYLRDQELIFCYKIK
jgi:outer membrane protein assembly factor BamB